MVRIDITDKMLNWAKRRHARFAQGWQQWNDFRKLSPELSIDEAGFLGILSEAVFWSANRKAEYMGEKFTSWDFTMDGQRYEVKSQSSIYTPTKKWYAHVNARKLRTSAAHRFAFVNVKTDATIGWYVGSISSKEFFEKAVQRRKGDKNPETGFEYRDDSWELQYSELEEA